MRTWARSILCLVAGEQHCRPKDGSDAPVCLDDDPSTCQLWLAPSTVNPGAWGVFAGSDLHNSSWLGVSEVVIPILDINMNEYSIWHPTLWPDDFLDNHPLYLESYYDNHMFTPGFSMIVQCQPFLGGAIQVELRREDVAFTTDGPIDDNTTPLTGAFSAGHNFTSRLIQPVQEGEELHFFCGLMEPPDKRPADVAPFRKEEATCLYQANALEVKATPTAGRGLVARKGFQKGDTIATTPLTVIDRRHMDIVEQKPSNGSINENPIQYTEHTVGIQLLVNYAYGHENSNVLLLPSGVGINFINHNATAPNAYFRWSTSPFHRQDWIDNNTTAEDLFLETDPKPGLFMDFVALRDIKPGEEILIDYGPAWERAWTEHLAKHVQTATAPHNMSAADYLKLHQKVDQTPMVIRTQSEQLEQPYPDNLRTACFYIPVNISELQNITWSAKNFGCLRHCDIQAREFDGENYWYTAVALPINSYFYPEFCVLPDHNRPLVVKRIPSHAMTLTDREYTSAFHSKTAFRHEIGVPEGFFPDAWMIEEASSNAYFDITPLKPFELQPFLWKESRRQVTYYGYRIGLDPKLRETLSEYANRLGITDYAKSLTIQGNGLVPDSNRTVQMQGLSWFLQRPNSQWASNMHWISPADEITHNDFLRVLSAAGFDEVLNAIGTRFSLDGLVCYHATFIAISHCSRGFVHHDFSRTGGKAFNVIIPMILVNETDPELVIGQGGTNDTFGLYRYEYDVAAVVGDDADHATAAVDYRPQKKMRFAATVYIADVNEYNVDVIMSHFTQAFPPSGDRQFVLNWAGKHWKSNDPNVRLPQDQVD